MRNSAPKLRLNAPSTQGTLSRQSCTWKDVTVYWFKPHVATIVMYNYTEFLSNKTTNTRHWMVQVNYQQHALYCRYQSFSARLSSQLRDTFTPFNTTGDHNVWRWWWRFHHTIAHGQIPPVANVETEVVWNIVIKSWYRRLNSSHDEFHHKPHHRCSSSHLDHAKKNG